MVAGYLTAKTVVAAQAWRRPAISGKTWPKESVPMLIISRTEM
ncbi:hypothetical protein [Candidatus Aquiluna sp. UB-MaderosW2red]|nr:hypothetical protein [Candidatus Aquiluna sp. UB-MaderosW2red]